MQTKLVQCWTFKCEARESKESIMNYSKWGGAWPGATTPTIHTHTQPHIAAVANNE